MNLIFWWSRLEAAFGCIHLSIRQCDTQHAPALLDLLHPDREILAESTHELAFLDAFPVSPCHALVVPKRHVATIFALTEAEYADCFLLVLKVKDLLVAPHTPDGFNVGVNCGDAGGQSVWHAHIHLIPRYTGDTPHPREGVRDVIPRKADY